FLTILGFTPIWFILYFLFRPDFTGVTLTGVLLSIPAMVLGFLVGYLLSAAITSLAFWTTRVFSIYEFFFALTLLFSGQFVPLTLMPEVIQNIAQYLPFQLQLYFPIQLIRNELSSMQIIQGFVTGIVWLILSILLFQQV